MLTIPEKHIQDCCKYYDKSLQLDILQEECAELIQAISKYKRSIVENGFSGHTRDQIVEEITHVLVSIGMIEEMFSISQYEIDHEVQKKIDKNGF